MGYYSDVALCRIKTGGVFKTICWHGFAQQIALGGAG